MSPTNLRKNVKEYFKKKGIHDLSPEERVKQNNRAFELLQSISKEDYEGTKKITRMLGGRKNGS